MTTIRKPYDTKSIFSIYITDYWNLQEHPLYFCLDDKSKPYIKIDEVPFPNSIKITSLQGLSNSLRKSEARLNDKRWNIIARHIQGYLNIHFS